MMHMFRYFYKGLLSDRNRTILCLLAVGAAVTIVLVLEGFQSGLWRQVRSYREQWPAQLVVMPEGASALGFARVGLSGDVAQKVAAMPDVDAVHPLVGAPTILVMGERRSPVTVIGYGTAGGPPRFKKGAGVTASGQVVVDYALAKDFGLNIGDTLPLYGRDFLIVGLSAGTASMFGSYVFISLADAYALLSVAAHEGGAGAAPSYLLVQTAPDARPHDVQAAIGRTVPGVVVQTPAEFAGKAVDLAKGIMGSIMSVLVIAAYVAGVMIIGMTLHATVAERTREHGIIKALGARNGRLYQLVFGYALLFTAAGFFVGVLAAFGISELLRILQPQYTLVVWDGDVLLRAGLAALVMAAIAALLPARQMQNVEPGMVFR